MRHFQPRLFAGLAAAFIIFTVVGTLSHEAGHWAIAKYYGFGASVHYGYTGFNRVPVSFRKLEDTVKSIRDKYQLNQRPGERSNLLITKNFPEKQYYETAIRKQQRIFFMITLGGPLQTMLTGTTGLVLLLINRRWWTQKEMLTVLVWVVVFASLFWLRQLFNLAMASYSVIGKSQWPFTMDETKLATYLHLWPATISLMSGSAGLGVLTFITLCVIPTRQRYTFIMAGLVGGLLGYWIWLSWLGPRLMP